MTSPTKGIWITDPSAYQAKLTKLAGSRDPIEILAATRATLREIVDRHTASQMRTRPFEGKWTPNEVIGHLVDAEWVFGYRLRLIYCEDAPTIVGMDQDTWVARQEHNATEPEDLVESFGLMRSVNLPMWKKAARNGLDRTGRHNERGVESLGTMLKMAAGHDLSHIDQINRYLTEVTGS